VERIGRVLQGGKVPNGVLDGGNVVEVEGVDTVFALLLAAVGSGEASVALASHGGLLVPELVDVTRVRSSELSDVLANAVAGAGVGARRSLTGNTIVAVEALAFTGGSVAVTLV